MRFRIQRPAVFLMVALAIGAAASLAFGQGSVQATGGGNNIFDVQGSAAFVAAQHFDWFPEAEGGVTFDLRLDSSADILLVDAAFADVEGGRIFNVTEPRLSAADANPYVCGIVCRNEFLATYFVDTWLTTPGSSTSAANDSSLVEGETVTHFDTSDDGAQDDFRFARIVLVPDSPGGMATATLLMSIQTAADPVPIVDDVAVTLTINPVPEPSSVGLVTVALLFGFGGCAGGRRSRHCKTVLHFWLESGSEK